MFWLTRGSTAGEGLAVLADGAESPPQADARSTADNAAIRVSIIARLSVSSGYGRAQALQRRGEDPPVEGLRHAGSEERGLIAEVVAVGEDEERQPRRRLLVGEPLRDLLRGQTGQDPVEHGHRGYQAHRGLDGLDAVRDLVDGVSELLRDPPHLAARPGVARGDGHEGGPELRRRPGQREREEARRPLVDLARHPELPSVGADDALADVEPEAEALDPGRPPVVETREGPEQPVHVLGRDADAVVGHA